MSTRIKKVQNQIAKENICNLNLYQTARAKTPLDVESAASQPAALTDLSPSSHARFGRVEPRREMIRPMTSDVSALSGIVANGHQAIQIVSSAPSKIPYGGFSPVRLQAGCQE